MHDKLDRLTIDQLVARGEARRRLVQLGVDPYAQLFDVLAITDELKRRRAAGVPA